MDRRLSQYYANLVEQVLPARSMEPADGGDSVLIDVTS